jgi:hypothetical protein
VVLSGATAIVKVAHVQLCHSRMLFAPVHHRLGLFTFPMRAKALLPWPVVIGKGAPRNGAQVRKVGKSW